VFPEVGRTNELIYGTRRSLRVAAVTRNVRPGPRVESIFNQGCWETVRRHPTFDQAN